MTRKMKNTNKQVLLMQMLLEILARLLPSDDSLQAGPLVPFFQARTTRGQDYSLHLLLAGVLPLPRCLCHLLDW